ncbi:hypothetical protein BDZ89DRAFT_1141687 [Hymenopellis radicata]|nr:hypothetical protein BDZ89DRAFT_1141687 [Hymenopellis radicata]
MDVISQARLCDGALSFGFAWRRGRMQPQSRIPHHHPNAPTRSPHPITSLAASSHPFRLFPAPDNDSGRVRPGHPLRIGF